MPCCLWKYRIQIIEIRQEPDVPGYLPACDNCSIALHADDVLEVE